MCALYHGRIARLTGHDDVIKLLLRGASRLGLALGPAPARPALNTHYIFCISFQNS